MRKLFIKLAVVLIFIFSFFLLSGYLADGYTDTYYLKFTSPKQKSLILGNSKALHGLIPNVFDSVLKGTYTKSKIFNYAFSLGHSPYGPTYYNALLKKLDSNSNNGLFILTVDPWSISSLKGSANNEEKFVERKLILGKLGSFNSNPNFEYLIKGYEGAWGKIYLNKLRSQKGIGLLHEDGWLEVNTKWDSLSANGFLLQMENTYKNDYLPATEPSSLRLAYLEKTINTLKRHGKVYLVRMPIHPRIRIIDEQLMPDFDNVITDLSKRLGVKYFNFIDSSSRFHFNDGVHLHKSSGRDLSFILASSIKDELKK